MKNNFVIISLSILGMISFFHQVNALCNWPKYFDVSKKYWEYRDEEKSWETQTKIDTEIYSEINGYYKSRQLITILNNETLEMTYHEKKQRVWSEKYECEREYNNDLFLVKRIDVVMNLLPGDIQIKQIDKSIRYRCMQLVKRSQFVVQWILGDLRKESHECYAGGFGSDLDPSPLIYFPIRNTRRDEKLFEYSKLLEEYPSCPKLGGYLMKVYETNGSHVTTEGCRNQEPSPRFEMECTVGEGLLILPSREPCPRYSYSLGSGSKLYCLGSWIQGEYSFTVLVPADTTVNSFHCLRMNKHDPSSENAILFLDNICRLGNPDPEKESFLRLSLRQKTISSICDDYSDHCKIPERDCEDIVQKTACLSSCNACPPDSPQGISVQPSLHGNWIIQKSDTEEVISIKRKTITLPHLGSFMVHAIPDKYVCHPVSHVLSDGSKYVLSTNDVLKGCSPRVIQLSMKNISESVSLLHFTSPSALRFSKYSLNSSTWCRNNQLEANANAQIFRPYWPFTTRPGSSLPTDGWYTVIKSDPTSHNPTPCQISGYKIGYAAYMFTNAYINIQGKETYKCKGEVRANDTILSIYLDNCDNNVKHRELIFDCLANYKMSTDYQALTLKLSDSSVSLVEDLQFYCLLLPTYGDRNRLAIILHSAGLCDYPLTYFVHHNHGSPLVKMTFLHSLVASSVRLEPLSYTLLLSLFLSKFRHF